LNLQSSTKEGITEKFEHNHEMVNPAATKHGEKWCGPNLRIQTLTPGLERKTGPWCSGKKRLRECIRNGTQVWKVWLQNMQPGINENTPITPGTANFQPRSKE
jgi:hypothetical protein